MTSLADRHLYPIFMLPSKLLAKFRGWIYGYIRLLLGMVCSVSCIFCVFTFIWYLTFRGLYGFLINLQLYQPPNGCGSDGGDNDLSIEYTDYQPGKRGSFLTRCRAQAELIQQTLQKTRTNGDKSPNGHSVKLSGDLIKESNGTNHHRCSNHNHNHGHHTSPTRESHGLSSYATRNSSYVSEIYYDENGHKIGEQIYLTNDSDGLEESYFQFKVSDVQHFKELGALSTSALVEEEPLEEDEVRPEEAEGDSETLTGSDAVDDKNEASGEDNEEKPIDSGEENNFQPTIKDRKTLSVTISNSPESTSSMFTDDQGNTFEEDSSAKTIDIADTMLTCSTTIIPTIKPSNQQLQESNGENVSRNNNYPDKICSTTLTQVQSDEKSIGSIVTEEETKDREINLVTIDDSSLEKVNCKSNGVQVNGESKQSANNCDESKSSNGTDTNKKADLIADQSTGPTRKPKRRRRVNNNYNRKNS